MSKITQSNKSSFIRKRDQQSLSAKPLMFGQKREVQKGWGVKYMSIYTQGGASVELVEAYKGSHQGGFYIFKAKQTGTYPDGSGEISIGKIIHADDRVAKGWLCIGDLIADDGIREIFDTADKVPEGERPENYNAIMHYYWPNLFDKKGRRK